MLLPDHQSLVSQYAMRALEFMREHTDLDAGQRLAQAQTILTDYAAMLDAGVIHAEDLEAALLSDWHVGQLQTRRRIAERCRAAREREQGFACTDEAFLEMFDGNVDRELLADGLRHAKPEAEDS